MLACTFFGHKDLNCDIKPEISKQIEALIYQHDVKLFYVGNNGKFDLAVTDVLKELRTKNPSLKYNTVLAYLPQKSEYYDYSDAIYPEGIECVPKRFSIIYRNKWMVSHSDFVVCYITHEFGGAFSAIEYARKHGKHIINIAEKSRKCE